jgi:hypothetical protein
LTKPSTSSLPLAVVGDVTSTFNISTYKININGKFEMSKLEIPICSHGIKTNKTKPFAYLLFKHLNFMCQYLMLTFTLGNGILHI